MATLPARIDEDPETGFGDKTAAESTADSAEVVEDLEEVEHAKEVEDVEDVEDAGGDPTAEGRRRWSPTTMRPMKILPRNPCHGRRACPARG